MPQRPLSPSDWNLVVRYINDAQHWLRAVNGSILRHRLDTSPEIAALESALKLLGHNEGDPMPAQVRDQVAKK